MHWLFGFSYTEKYAGKGFKKQGKPLKSPLLAGLFSTSATNVPDHVTKSFLHIYTKFRAYDRKDGVADLFSIVEGSALTPTALWAGWNRFYWWLQWSDSKYFGTSKFLCFCNIQISHLFPDFSYSFGRNRLFPRVQRVRQSIMMCVFHKKYRLSCNKANEFLNGYRISRCYSTFFKKCFAKLRLRCSP